MIDQLKSALSAIEDMEFAVLIGSQASGCPRIDSDWDIAVQWKNYRIPPLQLFARDEYLRSAIAKTLGISEEWVDIIDLQRAGLTIRSVVAEEGIPLMGEDDLPWLRFLTRTWRELEYWQWEQENAA